MSTERVERELHAPELLQEEQVDNAAETVKARFLQFLCEFGEVGPNGESYQNYSQQAETMRNTETSSLFVDFMHVKEHDEDLANAILSQYYRFEHYLRRGIFDFMKMEDLHYTINDDANKSEKEFFVCFYNMEQVSRIRDLKAKNIGNLVSFSGTVTRTSEVRPELLFGGFLCNECGEAVVGVEQQFKYEEPKKCDSPYCTNTNSWELSVEKSIFVDWQRVKVQENSDDIPAGSMPRTMDVILRHENVEQAKAGDRVVFTGSLIVVPDVSQFARNGEAVVATRAANRNNSNTFAGDGVRGLKALGVRELTYKLCFLACSVQTMEQRFNRISIRGEADDEVVEEGLDPEDLPDISDFAEQEISRIYEMKDDPALYTKMAKSLCPSVYGHDEIRRGILLMLFGGVQKITPDGIKLRGDLNVCIVGDPSTAKSQFLKYICSFLPRAIYTSGKVSSAAGLTASVTRDAETGEFCVEAGALMLADNGICCIDEFDKMDPQDQVAIHEAMEQQTISITKAGIQATLNARTSILAAANPYSGRYDRTKTLNYNVNITAPILSRFDLFFVIVDECDEKADRHIAEHIVNVHMQLESSVQITAYEKEDLQRYIKYARRFSPVISPAAKRVMVDSYRRLRENDVSSNGKSNIAYRITVRQLESMIRLSEALARMHLSPVVTPGHVREAFRLLKQSIIHVDTEEITLDAHDVPLPSVGDNEISIPGGFSTTNTGADTAGINDENAPPNPSMTEDSSEDELMSSDIPKIATKPAAPEKASLSFAAYTNIEKAVATYIRETEEDDEEGVEQGTIVGWYLEKLDISSEAELIKERALINNVIDRLIKDHTLVVLEDDEVKPNEENSMEERWLSVHPNYALE